MTTATKTADKSDGGGEAGVRPLVPTDLDRVVALDRTLSGRSRRGFFEARLAAALRDPKGFIQLGIGDGDGLAGYVFVRVLEGEFGTETRSAVLDAVGVDPGRQGAGLGRTLMTGLEDTMRKAGIGELQSQVDWTNHGLIRFLGAAGFRLAPRMVLGRTTSSAETDPF